MSTSIPDFPQGEDLLNVDSQISGLTDFIIGCETPFTITIEGAWGVGKTSVMAAIQKELRNRENLSFKILELNSWQYSLLSSDSLTPLKIFTGIIEKIGSLEIDEAKKKSFFRENIEILTNLLKVGVALASVYAFKDNADKAIDRFNETFFGEKNDIEELKNKIDNKVQEITRDKYKIIFFIDDLDRIAPEDAVSILEILKNVFDIRNCLFVLSIDSEIVQRGLVKKYGNDGLGEKNYKKFFDKIVQLNYKIPHYKYNLEKFYTEHLPKINFISENEVKEKIDFLELISEEIFEKNPRSLKKMINLISLKSLIVSYNPITADSQDILESNLYFFFRTALEIQYPKIEKLLNIKPYHQWDAEFAEKLGIVVRDIQKFRINESILKAACDKFEYRDDFNSLKNVFDAVENIISSKGEDTKNTIIEEVDIKQSAASITTDDLQRDRNISGSRMSNNYRKRMYDYLKDIEVQWDVYFGDKKDRVVVQDLLNLFSSLVEKDLKEDYPEDADERIKRFRTGAMLAQPKIMTINDRNRLNFNLRLQEIHDLFYYPDLKKGMDRLSNTWKNNRIQPFRKMPKDQVLNYEKYKN